MSVDQNEVGDADVMLANALAQAVREVGRALATEPRRVQGMVSDVLGAESRTRRAEIDAVVLAAEESVPEDLLAERIDVETAMMRLRNRGLDAAVAHFAVEVWRYALGMLAADAEPPSLTNSLVNSARGSDAVTDTPTNTDTATNTAATPTGAQAGNRRAAPNTVADFAPPTPGARIEPWTAVAVPPLPNGAPAATSTSKRRWLLIGVPLIVVALGVGLFIALKDDDATTAAPTTTQVVETTVEAATTTSASVSYTHLTLPTIYSV